MKIPRTKKVTHLDKDVKVKIEEMIEDALNANWINSYHLEKFNVCELGILADYAKENDILVIIKAEYSNFAQGILVQLLRKDCIEKFVKMGVF